MLKFAGDALVILWTSGRGGGGVVPVAGSDGYSGGGGDEPSRGSNGGGRDERMQQHRLGEAVLRAAQCQ